MKLLKHTILLILIASCSNFQINKKNSQTREEKVIESEKERVARYYRELREKDWENYKKGKRRRAFKSIVPRPYKKRKVVKKEIVYTPEQIQEFQIEIDQILSFFCMMNRKSKKYSDENDCAAFANEQFYQCKKKSNDKINPKVIKCLKKSLGVN